MTDRTPDKAARRPSAAMERRPGVWASIADSRLSGALMLLALLALWDVTARLKIVDLLSWPPFFDIAARWLVLLANGEIADALLISVWRVLVGYGAAVAIAVPIGLLIGYSTRVFYLLEPTLESLRPIPVVALIPVIILFFGLGSTMKIVIITYACFFPILLNTISGVRHLDRVLVDTARTFGLGKRHTILRVIVPAATPYIFTGMRISVGFSLMAMAAAEMLTGGDGIGAFILDAQRTFKVKDMYSGIITLGLLGYLANRGFIAIERWMLRWHGSTKDDDG